jgi:hypothetical protein
MKLEAIAGRGPINPEFIWEIQHDTRVAAENLETHPHLSIFLRRISEIQTW